MPFLGAELQHRCKPPTRRWTKAGNDGVTVPYEENNKSFRYGAGRKCRRAHLHTDGVSRVSRRTGGCGGKAHQRRDTEENFCEQNDGQFYVLVVPVSRPVGSYREVFPTDQPDAEDGAGVAQAEGCLSRAERRARGYGVSYPGRCDCGGHGGESARGY